MSHHAAHSDAPGTVERRPDHRRTDVVVVGGSAAGLAAALQLVRQRRSVIVVDSGEPRNAPAAHMHGYLGHEAVAPSELTAIGREEVRSYGGEVLAGRVMNVSRDDDDSFLVELELGGSISARRVLAATGLNDELPDIDGLAEHWGGDVIHCPFCHGYEARDQRVVQIVTHPAGLHPSVLFHQLTSSLTLVLHEGVDADSAELVSLRSAGVSVIDEQVSRVVTGEGGGVRAVELADGQSLDADAVVVATRFRARAEPFASLGLELAEHPMGLGDFVPTDETGATTIPGLYAAGNVSDPSQQVLHAAAAGSRVGAMISFSLAHEDLEAAARPSAVELEWDHRYGGDPMWSGNPNGTLVREITDLSPGRALDVGAGEGGDAIWMAEQGWHVTASDISAEGLAQVEARANARGLAVDLLRADVSVLSAFPHEAFDLVSAQYVPIPRSPDDRGIQNLLTAVAPGGTLLVVGHDLEAMRREQAPQDHGTLRDIDAVVRLDDIAAVLAETPGWEIEVHEKRPRPAGAASSHHVEDLVLRARRLS